MLKLVSKTYANGIFICKFHMKLTYEKRLLTYTQGQEPEPKVREYFYFIDHQGMLFLDDSRMKNFTSCFKDKKFLKFFFDHIKINETERYREHFPYLSLCGRERNFIRCDDYPFVYTHVINKDINGNKLDYFCYGHAGDLLSVPFEPDKIFMSSISGRVYHPAPERAAGIGLVKSNLAIEFSKLFKFDNGEFKAPTHFNWKDNIFSLNTSWYNESVKKNRAKQIYIRDDLLENDIL